MGKIRVLNQQEIMSVLDMQSVIEAVKKAFYYKSHSQAEVYSLICKMYENGGEFDIKSGECAGADVFGLKLVCGFPENVSLGLPRSNGMIVVYDLNHGLVQGIVDGVYITRIRTGAAAGIGVEYLARKDSKVLMILGAGRIVPSQIAATLEVMNEIEKVIICNPRHPEKAEQLAGNIKKQLKEEFISLYQGTTHYEEMLKKINIEFVSEASVQKACAEADIIITATNAREAVIQSEWIKPGTHLSCMGADMPVKQEIDEMLTARASLFADDIEQVTTVGECKIAYKKDMITKEQITEIGKVIAGQGTLGIEILEALPDVDAIYVPVGGGGMIAGIAIAVKEISPDTRVIGVEPEHMNAMYRSFHSGKIEIIKRIPSVADGLGGVSPCVLPYEIVSRYVDDMITVSEEEIKEATRLILQRTKMLAEPSGATALAGLLSGKVYTGKKNVCIVSGGNAEPEVLAEILSSACCK